MAADDNSSYNISWSSTVMARETALTAALWPQVRAEFVEADILHDQVLYLVAALRASLYAAGSAASGREPFTPDAPLNNVVCSPAELRSFITRQRKRVFDTAPGPSERHYILQTFDSYLVANPDARRDFLVGAVLSGWAERKSRVRLPELPSPTENPWYRTRMHGQFVLACEQLELFAQRKNVGSVQEDHRSRILHLVAAFRTFFIVTGPNPDEELGALQAEWTDFCGSVADLSNHVKFWQESWDRYYLTAIFEAAAGDFKRWEPALVVAHNLLGNWSTRPRQ